MKTVLQIVNRAYSKIRVKESGIDLTTEEIEDAISELNAMMQEHDADGLHVGWAEVSSSSDQINAPFWMTSLLENGLAIRMAPDFGVQPSMILIGAYEAALRVAEKVLVKIPSVPYPDILPTGSGEASYSNLYRYFSDPTADAIYSRTDGYEEDSEGNYITESIDTSNPDYNL